MEKTLDDILSSLPKNRQESVQKRADDLVAKEMTLRDLKLALKTPKNELCHTLYMKQDGISRLEQRSDMLLSTLNKYISAMGVA